MENVNVRYAARIAEVPFWKIANHLGISEATLTRWLRVPLSKEREDSVMSAIKELKRKDV